MESGVKLILNDLEKAIEKGVKIRILTGNYLNITQPQALYLLFQKNIDLRFYSNPNHSFHPKAYIFLIKMILKYTLVHQISQREICDTTLPEVAF